MTTLRIALLRIWGLFRKSRTERELDEEVRTHLELLAAEYVRKGMAPAEAGDAARREFGGVAQTKEKYRDQRGIPLIETIVQDLRYGLRQFRHNPGFAAVAVIALALGIGANTAIFSAVDAELLHPFPFKNLSQIVMLWESSPKQRLDHASVAPANFLDWSRENRTFTQLAAEHDWSANLTGRGFAERLEAYRVTAGFFPLLRAAPQLGRTIGASDFHPGQRSVVIFSHGFWQRRLGADPGIIGKNVFLNGRKFTVIGVMPKGFSFPPGAEAWAPLDLTGAAAADRANHYLRVLGRLKPGVSIAQAQADLRAIAARLGSAYPETNAGHGVSAVSLVQQFAGDARPFLIMLMGAAAFVLLLACANVMNLQLARGAGRHKEIAIRLAMGGSRWRITRQLLVETVMLAFAGGAAGALLASWGIRMALRAVPPYIVAHVAGLTHLRVDSLALAVTFGVALAAGILAGLVPARRASHPDLNEALKEGGRNGSSGPAHQRLRSALVVVEIALAVVLLAGAGLMVEGFERLATQDQGFDPKNVLAFSIALPAPAYPGKTQIREFYQEALQKVRGLPGVQSAGAVTSLPGGPSGWNATQYRTDNDPILKPGQMRLATWEAVTPGFFQALHIPLLKGRLLTAQDGAETQPVVVISKSFARQIYPGEDAVGRRIRFGSERDHGPWCTIVGIVGDVKQSPFDSTVSPTAYNPFSQLPVAESWIVVRTSGNPLASASAIRREMQRVDPAVPVSEMETLASFIYGDVSGVASSARMMGGFGLIALILAAAGIFALMAYSVAQRTHEIGVRVALGARPRDIRRLVLGHSLKLALAGIAIGLACALALARIMSGALLGVVRADPLVLAATTIILVLTAVFASYIPARRAVRVDPVVALRHE